jgi:uncharacterized protein YndB with AHSA1/START domain
MREGVAAGSRASPITVNHATGTVVAWADIPVPPERLYRTLVTAEVERWWGSEETYWMREWNAELRVGGRWRVLICFAGADPLPASGEFLEFDAPGRIVQTRRYEWDQPLLGRRETKVTYELSSHRGGTRLTVIHEGFAGLPEAAAQHAQGWDRVLGWLQAYARTLLAPRGAS